MEGKKIKRPVFDNPFLNIIENPDGSIKRDPVRRNPPNFDLEGTTTTSPVVVSKDVILDTTKKTWLRLYLPRELAMGVAPPDRKLPLIFYYHGGGFIFFSADTRLWDVFCKGLVEKVGAMVISLDYRLAPEHRLPAAYEDAIDGLHWLKNTKDDWVQNFADLENCYLYGTSAGGNLAYNAGLLAVSVIKDLEPLKIKGLILHHPFFSSKKKTASEKRLSDDSILPLCAINQMMDLSLPKGADHDHPYCNPFVVDDDHDDYFSNNSNSIPHDHEGSSSNLNYLKSLIINNCIREMKNLGWRVLVTGCYDDPLVDAGIECAKFLEAKGLQTTGIFSDGYHSMEVFDLDMSAPLFSAIKDFINSILSDP